MTSNFRKNFWRLSKWFGGLFCVLFIFRLIYGYIATNTTFIGDYSSDFFSSVSNLRKNYASEKIVLRGDLQNQAQAASSQQYEKTASIKIKSSQFESDEKLIREKTKSYDAVIQYEQNLGLKDNRELHLLIGVNPEALDSFYIEIQKIGVVKATEITKVDKTNEYRQLNAKKVSLEKTLRSLDELKSRGGQITDFVALHDKILEIESKLQELGIELGNFDAENELCTVKLSLYEGATEKKISLMHRAKITLEWTIKYYAIFVFTLLMLSCAMFILLLIVDKLKILKAISNKLNE